ncbi:MAG: hypothetical protein KC505_10420 [Myxococcales bacterium]|nr:hypothetical protein [Myxococcales bacterium]USN50413.1 MAG: hypothetical protein H6731_09145 [Myxococcales bacterium]
MAKHLLILLLFFVACAEEFSPVKTAKRSNQKNVNEQKIKKICDDDDAKIFKGSRLFSDNWSSCSRRSKGNALHTARCLQQKYLNQKNESLLSNSCADCFGKFAQCGYDNCYWTCAPSFGTSENCEKCGWKHCGNGLETCLGFSRSNLSRYFY